MLGWGDAGGCSDQHEQTEEGGGGGMYEDVPKVKVADHMSKTNLLADLIILW